MKREQPKYPDVRVRLVGQDGNAMSIIARVTAALRKAGHNDQCGEFAKEAMSGDYNNVLTAACRWVNVE